MALTENQQLEMYSDIKVIKNNCLMCKRMQENHEERLKKLEQAYWKSVGICSFIAFIIPLIISIFMRH